MAGAGRTGKPRLAVVFGHGVTVRELLRYGQDLADLILIFDGEDAALADLRLALQDVVECVEYQAGDESAIRDWHQRAPLDAITTFAENKVWLTARIAELLGLQYHTLDCARALTDKAAQRAALARAGLGLEFRVAKNAREAASLVRELGVRCVVKPVSGMGSSCVFAADPADALAALAYPPQTYPAVVEVRLEGSGHPQSDLLADMVSVETVSPMAGRTTSEPPTGSASPSHSACGQSAEWYRSKCAPGPVRRSTTGPA